MNFSVCIFNLLFSISLLLYYISKHPIEDDICTENRLYYYKYIRYLLYTYIGLLIIFVLGNNFICNNKFLLVFGFITIGFSTYICINMKPKKIQCIITDISAYFSLSPIIIVGIISLFLGYLGNAIKS